MYQPRIYRRHIHSPGLISYEVVEGETDLLISTVTNLEREARALVRDLRLKLSGYISQAPHFATSLRPVDVPEDAPAIVYDMATAARKTGVGPMAAVAGAVARCVGEALGRLSPEVIVENGGDIYLSSQKSRLVAIYAGNSPLSGTLGLEIPSDKTPVGICTSSATVGHSLSFGQADAAVAVAPSATLADGAATAIGNAVGSAAEINLGLATAQGIPGLIGAVIIIGDKLGVWGNLHLRALGNVP